MIERFWEFFAGLFIAFILLAGGFIVGVALERARVDSTNTCTTALRAVKAMDECLANRPQCKISRGPKDYIEYYRHKETVQVKNCE